MWWRGRGLEPGPAGLTLGGRPLADLAAAHGTPLYVYDAATVRRQVGALSEVLSATGCPWRIHYAMKANRFPPLLALLRDAGVGIDACSPREVSRALALGFAPERISVTASMLSDRDLDRLVGVHVNLDSTSALRRYGARVPRGTGVGLRLDPGVVVGYGVEKTAYGRSKFGFDDDGFEAGLRAAAEAGLVVDALHVHCGWGLRGQDAGLVDEAFARLAARARRVPDLAVVNVGGGLGARNRAEDEPLDPRVWGEAVRRHLAPLGVTIACEPGTFLVADAGVLVVEVNTVETKAGTTWVGVDAGHNVNVYPYHYGIPLEVVHVARPLDVERRVYAVAGNINEAGDILAKRCELPAVREGDLLALLPAGAYGASMASDHCMRGDPAEILV